jgi:DNA-binding MarR family transcriptional regulator
LWSPSRNPDGPAVQPAVNSRRAAPPDSQPTHQTVIPLDGDPSSRKAEIIRVQGQTIGKTIIGLESRGYIHRVPNPSDRRSHFVSLTDAGDTARKQARDLERSVLAGAAVDTDKLRTELKTIVLALGTQDAAGGPLRNPG